VENRAEGYDIGMIVTSRSSTVVSYEVGTHRLWALSDGYLDMPAALLRDERDDPAPQVMDTGMLRLAVNCFALKGPDGDGVLVDCGGGSWAPTVGRLAQSMAEAGIDPASITTLALTHTHQDHIHGLLARGGRVLLPNLQAIVIPAAAVDSFLDEPDLAQFGRLLKPLQDGAPVAAQLRLVTLPGHAAGHSGYAFDSGDDRILFIGDIVHVPALQFDKPSLSWGYDDDQPIARATRRKVFDEAADTGMWIAGAHLDWPGIGRVIRAGDGFRYESVGGSMKKAGR